MVIKIDIEERPWGWFEKYNENSKCSVKLIYVKAKKRLSLQYHNSREEFWRIIRGPVQVQIGDRKFIGKEGDFFHIPKGSIHRLSAIDKDSMILEISYGHFDENDIVRIEDDFGRAKEMENIPN